MARRRRSAKHRGWEDLHGPPVYPYDLTTKYGCYLGSKVVFGPEELSESECEMKDNLIERLLSQDEIKDVEEERVEDRKEWVDEERFQLIGQFEDIKIVTTEVRKLGLRSEAVTTICVSVIVVSGTW